MSETRVVVLILAALVIVTTATPAQPPDTAWARIWDYAPYDEHVNCVKALPDGGFVAGGITYYQWEDYQSWTARLNANGDTIWEHIEGDEPTQATEHIEPTSDGGFIHCGDDLVYWNPVNFQAFVRKLNGDGIEEWARAFDEPNNDLQDYFLFVTEVPAGGYVLGGQFGPWGSVMRLGPNGGVLWERRNETGSSAPRWVEPAPDDGFIVPVKHEGAFTLLKLNSNGLIEWMNNDSMPGEIRDGFAQCVRISHDGSLYACGFVDDDLGQRRFYVTKRTYSGDIIWWLMIAQNAYGGATELKILGDGNLAVTGWSQVFNEQSEIWLVKISSETGEVIWHYQETYGEAVSVDQARDGGIIMSVLPLELGNDYPLDLKLVKFEPEVVVDLTPQTTVVPAEGGMIRYTGAVSNMLIDPTPQRVWASVITPAGQEIPLQVIPVTLQPGGTFSSGIISQYIPAWAPPGEYRYCLHIGAKYGDPLRNMGYDEFTFVKQSRGGRPQAEGHGQAPGPGIGADAREAALPWPAPGEAVLSWTDDPADLPTNPAPFQMIRER